MQPIEQMTKEEKIIILESMIKILGLCRTEREMLEYCKGLIEKEEEKEDD